MKKQPRGPEFSLFFFPTPLGHPCVLPRVGEGVGKKKMHPPGNGGCAGGSVLVRWEREPGGGRSKWSFAHQASCCPASARPVTEVVGQLCWDGKKLL